MNILSEDLFYQHVGHKPDVAARRLLWDKAQGLGLPTHKDEDWKYTRLKNFAQAEFKIADHQGQPSFQPFLPQADYLLVLQSGLLREDLSRLPLSEELVIKALTADEMKLSDKYFENLSQALCPQGLGIELAKNQENKTLEIVHLGAENSVSAVFITGKVGRNSQLTVLESVVSGQSGSFINERSLWRLEEGAQLKYYQNHQPDLSAYLFQSFTVEQSRDSYAEYFNFSAGGAISRHDVQMSLNEPGASAKMFSLYLSQEDQQVDYCTAIHHRAPHCTSEQLCKGLLSGRGQGVFNGLVHIYKDAQKTNAAQVNKNLLLSEKAQANTRPRLLVDADDVKAAHGATVGQLDPEEIFYLQSRGMPKERAVKMLAQGFAKEVVFGLSDEKIKNLLLEQVEKAMDSVIEETL